MERNASTPLSLKALSCRAFAKNRLHLAIDEVPGQVVVTFA